MGVTKRVMTPAAIRSELAALEAKYGMTSDEFYPRFNRGELGDDREYLKWASLYDWAARARKRKPVRA
ncbi:MAG: hypothetical protein Q7T33_06565 [Dehalococcoidia bacterium]|nr:hypothetical protein [Dehalococcoidia bacterium]